MCGSIHGKLARVRKPRADSSYDIETEGDQVMRELPFVVGVMGDFSADPTQPLRPLSERNLSKSTATISTTSWLGLRSG